MVSRFTSGVNQFTSEEIKFTSEVNEFTSEEIKFTSEVNQFTSEEIKFTSEEISFYCKTEDISSIIFPHTIHYFCEKGR